MGFSLCVEMFWTQRGADDRFPSSASAALAARVPAQAGATSLARQHQEVMWQQFNNNVESVQFGSLIKTAVSAPNSNYPRQIQLGMKLMW